ncbi:unnamed protein product, partial [Brenthis ino]
METIDNDDRGQVPLSEVGFAGQRSEENMQSNKASTDCMDIRLCPDVRNWSQEESREKLLKSLCEIKERDNGSKSFMICCSDFALNVTVRYNETVETENNIDNHSNIGLLPENCGKQFDDRLNGGNFTGIYEFPWMALISHVEKDSNGIEKRRFNCGGTIISSRYILTAAHCVYEKKIAGVRVGEYNIHSLTDCQGEWPNYVCESHLQDLRVEKATIHEAYSTSPRLINDIAILRVNKEIDFSFKNVKPICLPVWKEARNVSLSGKRATVAGWGVTETGKWSNILHKVIVPIKAETYCTEYLERYSDPQDHTFKVLCAGEVGKDSCKGDSGGPLMLFEDYKDDYRMIQYGIVSYGQEECGSASPGVYTDITKYMKWILDNIKE